ncbi:hypothetical protein V493_03621 [Pseudogymnoascus sp. VKM F-4281 (FW-2241)]|nr:hypothetical protein V493_03621 [Pseudogymnoascus sp. VKM F-4281 (FW-2241)]
MSSKSNTVALAQTVGLSLQAAVAEPTELAYELWPIGTYNKQHSAEKTVAPGLEQVEFGEGSSGGEERQPIEPETASVMAERPYKARKPAKNPTPAMIEGSRARAIAAESAARLKQDMRTADEIYGTNGLVTAESHPHTFSVQFQEHGLAMGADFMGVRSFQNCLELYVARESPEKQRSSHRPVDTLRRISEKNPIPPAHYPRNNPQVCASWRHEIGYPSEGSSGQKEAAKWVTRYGEVHRLMKGKDGKVIIEDRPEMPTEVWYAILAKIHHDHGHHGRDEVFRNDKSITPSISKGFVAAYVSCCCLQRKSPPRKVKNVRETFAGEELAKTGKPSKGKKRATEAADPDSQSPAAKRPRVDSTEPVMADAGNEQGPSLRNDSSPAQMGVGFPIAMADPSQGVAGPVENYREVIAHQAAPQIPEGSTFDVAGIEAAAPTAPGLASTTEDSLLRPEEFFGLGAEDWQGDDGDWLVQWDNTSHPQSKTADDPGLSMDLVDPSVDIYGGNISDEELSHLLFECWNEIDKKPRQVLMPRGHK